MSGKGSDEWCVVLLCFPEPDEVLLRVLRNSDYEAFRVACEWAAKAKTAQVMVDKWPFVPRPGQPPIVGYDECDIWDARDEHRRPQKSP